MKDKDLYFLSNGIFWKKARVKVVLDGTSEQVLGGNMQTDVGLIIGMSLWADSVGPANEALITTTQAMNLYLSILTGGKKFIPDLRLDDLLNVYNGSPVASGKLWTEFNLPWWAMDFQTSSIINPLLLEGPVVWINLFYIPKSQYNLPPLGAEGASLTKVPIQYSQPIPVPQSSPPPTPTAPGVNQ